MRKAILVFDSEEPIVITKIDAREMYNLVIEHTMGNIFSLPTPIRERDECANCVV